MFTEPSVCAEGFTSRNSHSSLAGDQALHCAPYILQPTENPSPLRQRLTLRLPISQVRTLKPREVNIALEITQPDLNQQASPRVCAPRPQPHCLLTRSFQARRWHAEPNLYNLDGHSPSWPSTQGCLQWAAGHTAPGNRTQGQLARCGSETPLSWKLRPALFPLQSPCSCLRLSTRSTQRAPRNCCRCDSGPRIGTSETWVWAAQPQGILARHRRGASPGQRHWPPTWAGKSRDCGPGPGEPGQRSLARSSNEASPQRNRERSPQRPSVPTSFLHGGATVQRT